MDNTVLHRVKWIIAILCLSLLIIIVFQNLAETEVHLLFSTVRMPQAALLTVTLVLGFALGLAARPLWKVRRWSVRSAASHKSSGKSEKAAAAESDQPLAGKE